VSSRPCRSAYLTMATDLLCRAVPKGVAPKEHRFQPYDFNGG
jgi:hypothetical protein